MRRELRERVRVASVVKRRKGRDSVATHSTALFPKGGRLARGKKKGEEMGGV
jgi:hypothetical protein